jgi:hypothetical protein
MSLKKIFYYIYRVERWSIDEYKYISKIDEEELLYSSSKHMKGVWYEHFGGPNIGMAKLQGEHWNISVIILPT